MPRNPVDWQFRQKLRAARVFAHQIAISLLGDLVAFHPKTVGDRGIVNRAFVEKPAFLTFGTTHAELPGRDPNQLVGQGNSLP